MRKRTRLATTAGVTVLGFTAMSGMSGAAQADTRGGLGLPDVTAPLAKTGPLGKTVDNVVKTVTGPSSSTTSTRSSGGSGLHVNVPVHVGLSVPSGRRASSPALKANVNAGVKASTNPLSVRARANVRLCASPSQACGRQPSPPSPIPPGPPTPPPAPPIVNPVPPPPPGSGGDGTTTTPSSASLTVIGNALPFTGGPIGALAFIGVLGVLTGAAGVAGSRLRAKKATGAS